MTVHAYEPLPRPSELDPYVRSFHLDRCIGPLEASRFCRIFVDGGGNRLDDFDVVRAIRRRVTQGHRLFSRNERSLRRGPA